MKFHYNSIEDITSICDESISESVRLEYKDSEVLKKQDTKSLCKTVTALANSAGGEYVIGIESENEAPIKLDGGLKGRSKLDWMHKVLTSNTYPPVESLKIIELQNKEGFYYVIQVPPSPQAPHQASDKRYYKRHGTHSEPMEHYEIEDVRNRPKFDNMPLLMNFTYPNKVAHFSIKNGDPRTKIENLKFTIKSNFDVDKKILKQLENRGLKQLLPSEERIYWIDTVPNILGLNEEAEVFIDVEYEFKGNQFKDNFKVFLADLINASLVKTNTDIALEDITKALKENAKQLQIISKSLNYLERSFDGTGLRLSQRTLRSFKNQNQKFDPLEFDWKGYQIILGVSNDEAKELYKIFYFHNGSKARFEKLDDDVKSKFNEYFSLPS